MALARNLLTGPALRSPHVTEEPGVHSRRDSIASDRHRGEYRDFQRGECDSPEVHACSQSRTVASGAVDGRTENSHVYGKRLFNHAAQYRGAQLVLVSHVPAAGHPRAAVVR